MKERERERDEKEKEEMSIDCILLQCIGNVR